MTSYLPVKQLCSGLPISGVEAVAGRCGRQRSGVEAGKRPQEDQGVGVAAAVQRACNDVQVRLALLLQKVALLALTRLNSGILLHAITG
jgi:hypothetical protein